MFKEELIIVRHARSRHNTRNSESLDDGITEFGERQAKNIGHFFSQEVDLSDFKIFSSPFLRCLQTTAGLTTSLDQDVIVKPTLREYLNHSGRSVHVVNRAAEYPRWDWSAYPKDGVTYDEEFNEVFLHRMHEAYTTLPEKSVVVTHGLPALTLLHVSADRGLRSVPIWDHSIDNCSISIIRRGRVIWHGRNLYHELDYDPKFYRRDWDGVVKREHPCNA